LASVEGLPAALTSNKEDAMSKRAVAIRHVPFEDLGLLDDLLARRGYTVQYRDAGIDPLGDAASADLVVILGGPIGAYEDHLYPFLKDELTLAETRLAAAKPLLGVCLGAQLMARALGAKVYPGPRKEIGFAPLALTEAGQASCLAPFGEPDVPVLHWHGDTFDLPDGTVRLASTPLTPNQAFSLGSAALGLQFHGEARGAAFERWLIGHACEIAAAGLSPADLRADGHRLFPTVERHGVRVLAAWLDGLAG
jgi:GMP synthase (glutamine-hydrolysing)